MVPVLNIVRGSVTENLQHVAENLHTVAETLHGVPARVATVQRVVAQDMRALWEGAEANFHQDPAVNDVAAALEETTGPLPDVGWRMPLGWISLAAGAVAIAGLGLMQIEVRQRREATAQQNQKPRGLSKKAFGRGKSQLARTDWSKSG